MSKCINFHAVTNDEYKKEKHFQIEYGITETKFGNCLIGLHNNEVCYLSLFDEGKENSAIDHLKNDWPNAELKNKDESIKEISKTIFDKETGSLDVLLKGTDLQVKVWKELAKLKEGMTITYEQVAKAVGNPKAIRAVASAIAKNRIAYLIPCHRVIRKAGAPNKYRWGPERKEKILKYEAEQ